MRWLYKGISKRRKDENGLNISNKVQCEINPEAWHNLSRAQELRGNKAVEEKGEQKNREAVKNDWGQVVTIKSRNESDGENHG